MRTSSVEPNTHTSITNSSRITRPYFFRYISNKGIQNIPTYKYHGTDASYLYQHVVSPALNHAIDNNYIPRWIHPNLITLTGLFLMIVSHCITWYYCPTFTEEAPWWVWVFNATAMVLYWVLDALDGKQARKLQLSSPLGLLVDHGCDALNTTIGMQNVAAMLCVGPTMKAFFLWTAPAAVFFAATWEEYYVGSLNLPLINGPNEGVLLGALFHIWTAYVGTHWWQEESIFGFQKNTVLILVLSVLSIATIITNTVNVSEAVAEMQNGKGKFSSSQRTAGCWNVAASRGVPFVAMVLFAGLWAQYSPSNVLGRNPRLFIWILGLCLCKLVMTLMVAHLSDDEYHPFGRTLAGVSALAAHMLLTYRYIGFDLASENLFLTELGAVVFLSYVHMVYSLVVEISRLLDITVVSVPLEKQKMQ